MDVVYVIFFGNNKCYTTLFHLFWTLTTPLTHQDWQHVHPHDTMSDSSVDMTSTYSHGVSLEAVVTEDGHPSLASSTTNNVYDVTLLNIQRQRHFHVRHAYSNNWHFPQTNHSSPLYGQSQHNLFRPIMALVSPEVTPHHATRRVISSTVVTSEGHANLFIFPAKLHLPTCTVSQATKLHFSKLGVFANFSGTTAPH
jgi:hypothetical protein